MEISWLGRNCFRLKGREGVVLTDPCPPEGGYRPGKNDTVSVVTVSRRDEPGYNASAAVPGTPLVLDAPGEYEVGGILVNGIATRRDDGSRNVVFVSELDGIRVAHLGLITTAPSAAVLEELNDVDVLLMPVGGVNGLAPALAADVMTSVDPKIVIPMNFKTELEQMDLEPLDRFLKETGAKPEPVPKLTVSRTQMPSDLTVVILQPRG